MEKFANYILKEKIHETRNSIIYRGQKENDALSVIIKVLKTKYPTPSEIARFRQEYNLVKNLDIDGIVRTYDLVETDNRFAIIEEDFDGVSLREMIVSKKIGIKTFLQIAKKVSETLGLIHKNNIIHLDIKPDNILINAKKGMVKISDFGISEIFTHSNDELYNPEVIEGTLPYISPEQTGRMNRSVDYRTDLYSLGITFYEMLMGDVPFKSRDPMELIHSHIARRPAAPNELNPSIPAVISDIIMKLLSKSPEERYQNSLGLTADIEDCLRQLNTGNIINKFPLASRDISIKFNIPQILIGREDELNVLMSAFERSSSGASEMMLVMGYPGIGKSSLIYEIQRPIAAKKGYFISGKYDRFRKDVPYSSIIQAFQGLIKQLLSESDERISSWREKLLAALHPNGKVITDVIPDLEYIIGKQPDVETPGPEESQNRFNIVFQNFINIFTTADHPMTLFLDDLQWADMASLKIIKTIMTGSTKKFLFLIGAYRDNEVSLHHPLSITLNEIRKKGTKINSISLTPLNSVNVNKMIKNVLQCKAEESAGLAELIHKKTAGNPFFVNQFLKNLYDNRAIELDPKTGWTWNMNKIQEMQFTDNVVELMAGKISNLPVNTREVLKICACIGNRFDLESLSIILGKTIEEILVDITPVIQEGLIGLFGDVYKFRHDRIQEAAYSLIPDNEKSRLHYLVGNNILEKTPEQYLEDKIFYIVDHLNKGIDFVTEAGEKLHLAEMNLKAAQKAKNSTAYTSALFYLKTGIGLLPGDCWEILYELTYSIYQEIMECEYLSLNFGEAEKIFNIMVKNAKSNIDRANVHSLMIILYTTQGNYEKALKVGYEGMKMVGFRLPEKVSDARLGIELLKLRLKFGRMKIEDLMDLPYIPNPKNLDEAQRIIDALLALPHPSRALAKDLQTMRENLAYAYLAIHTGTVAYYIDSKIFAFIVINGIILLLDFGINFEYSPYAFLGIGSIVGSALGFYQHGYRFGTTALKLNENIGNTKNRSRLEFTFTMFIQHWRKHARYDLDIYREAYKHGLEVGDLIFCSHSIKLIGETRIMLGDNIDELLEEYTKYRDFQMGSKDPFNEHNYQETLQMCLCLKGLTGKTGRLNSDDFNVDEHMLYYRKEKNLLGVFYLSLIMLMIHYLFGNYTECQPIIDELKGLINKKIYLGALHVPEAIFYSSLVMTAVYPDTGTREKIKYKIRLMLNQMKMKAWARNCPENFKHKYLLVEAERTRLSGKRKKAAGLYDRAIKSARENQYTQNEAIANERAALFMRETGDIEKARQYMKEAHYGYIKWGAAAKVKDIGERYPDLIVDKAGKSDGKGLSAETETTAVISGMAASQTLDLTTIIRTSQTLSSEIDIDKLLVNIMKLSIENAGAQHGYLILENDDDRKLSIMASGKVDETIEVMKSIPLEGNKSLSVSIVNYVHKTGENVVLGNASADQRFINDPYVIKNRPKSILCASIRHKGKAAGIIYLENNLTTDAFTPYRIELIQIFSSQAAIAIENSRLIAHRENEARLQTEINIAANIQSVLLPENPAIDGFEITAFMKPTNEIGGDYYDVINCGDYNWVIIGDVSGHGVPSGLVMMMVQTAIQTLLRTYPGLKPSDLLTMINKAIKYNINKMNDDKYMTITAFCFGKNGKVVYSGLHQNIFIYRASSGEVEKKPSDGIWLSAWDMGWESVDCELEINHDDVMLLYTDGVIEARGPDAELFSEERLAEILKKSGRLDTGKIRDRVLKELDGFSINDDVTMVILKKK